PGQPHHLAVAARDLDAADRRRLHVVEFLTPLLRRLPATRRTSAGSPEGTRGTAPATAATWTRRTTAGSGPGSARACPAAAAGPRTARAGTAAAAAATATATGPGTGPGARTAAASAAGTAT